MATNQVLYKNWNNLIFLLGWVLCGFSTINLNAQHYPFSTIKGYKADKELKEVWQYQIVDNDSFLTKEYYLDGLRQRIQSFNKKNILWREETYKYNESGQLIFSTERKKGKNQKDSSSVLTMYLYDQYNNLYYESRVDSNPLNYPGNGLRNLNKVTTSYVYDDSLILYTNEVNDLDFGIMTQSKRFEYDSLKRLIKEYYCGMMDSTNHYRLTNELFYNAIGNNIKTINYCDPYSSTDLYGKKLYRPCNDDTTFYEYNSAGKLINVNNGKGSQTIYNYDNQMRLISVFCSMKITGIISRIAGMGEEYNDMYHRYYKY